MLIRRSFRGTTSHSPAVRRLTLPGPQLASGSRCLPPHPPPCPPSPDTATTRPAHAVDPPSARPPPPCSPSLRCASRRPEPTPLPAAVNPVLPLLAARPPARRLPRGPTCAPAPAAAPRSAPYRQPSHAAKDLRDRPHRLAIRPEPPPTAHPNRVHPPQRAADSTPGRSSSPRNHRRRHPRTEPIRPRPPPTARPDGRHPPQSAADGTRRRTPSGGRQPPRPAPTPTRGPSGCWRCPSTRPPCGGTEEEPHRLASAPSHVPSFDR